MCHAKVLRVSRHFTITFSIGEMSTHSQHFCTTEHLEEEKLIRRALQSDGERESERAHQSADLIALPFKGRLPTEDDDGSHFGHRGERWHVSYLFQSFLWGKRFQSVQWIFELFEIRIWCCPSLYSRIRIWGQWIWTNIKYQNPAQVRSKKWPRQNARNGLSIFAGQMNFYLFSISAKSGWILAQYGLFWSWRLSYSNIFEIRI